MKQLTVIMMVAVVLLVTSCTRVDFNNPLDPKGKDYLFGDKECEAEKIKDEEEGAGLFTRPELGEGCDNAEN